MTCGARHQPHITKERTRDEERTQKYADGEEPPRLGAMRELVDFVVAQVRRPKPRERTDRRRRSVLSPTRVNRPSVRSSGPQGSQRRAQRSLGGDRPPPAQGPRSRSRKHRDRAGGAIIG